MFRPNFQIPAVIGQLCLVGAKNTVAPIKVNKFSFGATTVLCKRCVHVRPMSPLSQRTHRCAT
jgi:hypothetical protein